MKRLFSTLIILTALCMTGAARDFRDSVETRFRQSKSSVDLDFDANRLGIDSLINRLSSYASSDSAFRIDSIRVVGAASPEGSVAWNMILSRRRADNLLDYIRRNASVASNVPVSYDFVGRDWRGLRNLVAADQYVPAREEILSYVDSVIADLDSGAPDDAAHLTGLQKIDQGRAYSYMYRNLFPQLRQSVLYLDYNYRPFRTFGSADTDFIPYDVTYITPVEDIIPIVFPVHTPRNFYMGLKTNLLYDALALPSISAEFYLGKNLSVVGNWTYGWWNTDRRHRYWRAYGGDIALRWWFGSKAAQKPLTGHHLGVYGGVFTYDFEFGGEGHMGGRPGHSLWDKCLYNAGIEYGYSLPIARRLNLDFTIGIGYIHGQYYDYIPQDGHYVWQSTHNLNWFGPTKAEISLVWLIGHGNYNSKKGGRI